MVTRERFQQGMTLQQYLDQMSLAVVGNLREAGLATP